MLPQKSWWGLHCIYIHTWLYMYIHSHPEVDEIWKFQQYSHFDDLVWHFHILSTPGLVHMGSHPPKSKYWELVQLMFPGRLRGPLPLNIYNNICYISIIVSYPLISWVPSVHFLEHLCSKTCFCRMHIFLKSNFAFSHRKIQKHRAFWRNHPQSSALLHLHIARRVSAVTRLRLASRVNANSREDLTA